MRQSRLESYFEAPASHPPRPGPSFLDLPRSVRRLVYEYIGLGEQTIDLNFSNAFAFPWNQYPDTALASRSRCVHSEMMFNRIDDTAQFGEDEVWEMDEDDEFSLRQHSSCSCLNGFGLLFVSQQVSREVLPLIYSLNAFTVRQGCPGSLKRLRHIGKQGAAALTSLTLKLEPKRYAVFCDGDNFVDNELPEPLSLDYSTDRAAIEEYREVVVHLSKWLRSNTLSLYLVFRVMNLDTLQAVLDPLGQLPVLQDCGIWTFVGARIPEWAMTDALPSRSMPWQMPVPSPFKIPDAQVDEIAPVILSTIHNLTQPKFDSKTGFPFLQLPTELRLNILEHTDLVMPFGVQWRPRMTSPSWQAVKRSQCYCYYDLGFDLAQYVGGCLCEDGRYTQWKRNNHEVEGYNMGHESCCRKCRPMHATKMCFCSKGGRTNSTTCTCQKKRHPLFAVSRQVREDAIATYYSRNHIFVTAFDSPLLREIQRRGGWPPIGINNMASVELSLYISSLRHSALQSIRWLEWILPTANHKYLRPRTAAWFDYIDTLDMMRHAMNTESLTFVLNMAAQQAREYRDAYNLGPGRLRVKAMAWKWYEQIALELCRLGPLKDCFIYLSYSARDVGERMRREKALEQAIMGSQYDSSKRGKPVERLTAFHRAQPGLEEDHLYWPERD